MSFRPVEWVLAVLYGSSAHRATYGRLQGTTYTKDYIQLSRRPEFLAAAAVAFPRESPDQVSVPLTFKWPGGSQAGAFVYRSADRPHLKWETVDGPPLPWKMTPAPGPSTVETLPGNPSHKDSAEADKEFARVVSRCGGQPYLLAVKLAGEDSAVHLRVYIDGPDANFTWADADQLPSDVLELVKAARPHEASKASAFASAGVVPSAVALEALDAALTADDPGAALLGLGASLGAEIAAFLQAPGTGLFFDPHRNYDAWLDASEIEQRFLALDQAKRASIIKSFASSGGDDSMAEAVASDPEVVKEFTAKIANKEFGVADKTATLKVRGSAQQAFAAVVKSNYRYRCAITGISTRQLLIASHIVPWSEDETIRLDPRNGICLSPIVDRAFEVGLIEVDSNLTVIVRGDRINSDDALLQYLMQYHGTALRAPVAAPPEPTLLARRAELMRKMYEGE